MGTRGGGSQQGASSSSRLQTQPLPEDLEPAQPPPPSGPKRQNNDDGEQHTLKRARLTSHNLALFDKMSKKRDKSSGKLSLAATESVISSSSSKTTSTTTTGFAKTARKNGIFERWGSKPPVNLEDLHKRGLRSRGTASPTASEYNRYATKVAKAYNESTMLFEVGSKLLKEHPDGYARSFNMAFSGHEQNVGYNNGLSAPQPDYVEGIEAGQFDPVPIDDVVASSVLYKDVARANMTFPHLAGEWKGRGRDMEEAELQCAYDGAALVYSRSQALSYIGKPDPPRHAHVTTFATDGTTLNLYAHYAAPSPSGALQYHQYLINSTSLAASHQGLKNGRRQLRNEQDYAKEQSYALRDQVIEHWNKHHNAIAALASAYPSAVDSVDGVDGVDGVDNPEGPEAPEQYFLSLSHHLFYAFV